MEKGSSFVYIFGYAHFGYVHFCIFWLQTFLHILVRAPFFGAQKACENDYFSRECTVIRIVSWPHDFRCSIVCGVPPSEKRETGEQVYFLLWKQFLLNVYGISQDSPPPPNPHPFPLSPSLTCFVSSLNWLKRNTMIKQTKKLKEESVELTDQA